jgi:hypothetical protein
MSGSRKLIGGFIKIRGGEDDFTFTRKCHQRIAHISWDWGILHIPPDLVVEPRYLRHPLEIVQSYPHPGSSAATTI